MVQLEAALERDEVVLYAYVLMPNHYHLFVETPLGNIQRFMQRLNTAYSMYFRYKHARPGHCLQGRYKAKLVSGDDYILRLIRYIHLNPVKTEDKKKQTLVMRKQYLADYQWSSYRGYIGEDAKNEFVDYKWLNLMGRKTGRGRQAAYRRYVEVMLGEADETLGKALDASMYAIGSEEFVGQAESELKEMRMARALRGDVLTQDPRLLSLEDVISVVISDLGVRFEDLRYHGRRAGIKKALAIELCCKFVACTQREVAKYFGYVEDSPVTRQRAMFRRAMKEDACLSRQFDRLCKKLTKVEKTINKV